MARGVSLPVVAAWACLAASASASESPVPQAGCVLWLDASDAATVRTDSEGRVEHWADKSPRANHAAQTSAAERPTLAPDVMGGRPALRFDGKSHLRIGQSPSLGFRPGKPFSIVVAAQVAGNGSGTFLAKGGGSAGERAYQFYATRGRIGTVLYGRMVEAKTPGGPAIAALLCDGRRGEVRVNGRLALTVAAGSGDSDADVLVGARRKNSDNTGTFFPLEGDLAEMLVYDRALRGDEFEGLTAYLARKYSVPTSPTQKLDAAAVVASSKPDAIDRVAQIEPLVASGDAAAPVLRSSLQRHPETASAVGEELAAVAEKNALSNELASLAGELLARDDPFVRGLADWAIAMKIGGENNGQVAVWPGDDPPAWYRAYASQPQSARVENDWVRQAASLGIHRDPARLAASIEAMVERAGVMADAYRRAGAPADSLALVERRLGQLRQIRGEPASSDLAQARRRWLDARRAMRDIALANPAIDFSRLAFLEQFVPHTVRNITRSYAWKHKPGGDICILDDVRRGGPARPLLNGRLGPGYVWGLDLWWDADRVVFGYARLPKWPPSVDTANNGVEGTHVWRLRKIFEPLHVFECRLDSSDPVQLTRDAYWSDFEPTYCANGDVVFASDRCARAAECGNDTYDHTNPNLYILSRRDGSVRKLTDSKDIDRYPHSLDDGRIAYTHWEYQERHFMEVHALWTIRPDGRMCDAVYKHHMRAPLGLRDTRSVPGSAKLVSTAVGHHCFAYGPVVLVDPAHGTNDPAGLAIVTPGVRPQEGPMAGKPVPEGGVRDAGGLYQTPWALSETCFLVSYAYARPSCKGTSGVDGNGFGLYLIDVYGNRELVHRDPLLSCTFPIPIKKRPRPPVLPDVHAALADAAWRAGEAVCYVTDVYDGLPSVPRGTIRCLRVSQRVPWPFDPERGQQDYIPGNAGTRRFDFQDWAPARVIGTVPVEADGSAHFTVPADTAIYFQALDERQMEVLRMRSFVSFKEGEVRGCRGCHESQAAAPSGLGRLPMAMQKEACVPTPPPWGAERLLGYEWLVQPVFDRHCTACHSPAKAEGGIDLSGSRASDGLLQSFHTLFGVVPAGTRATKPVLVACSNRFDHADVTQPMQFGSHRSRLIRVLLDDPLHREKVKLGPEDWTALVTWVDANAPYYDAFVNKRPAGGGPPRRDVRPPLRPLVADAATASK